MTEAEQRLRAAHKKMVASLSHVKLDAEMLAAIDGVAEELEALRKDAEEIRAKLDAALESEAVYRQLCEDAKPFAKSNIALRAELEAKLAQPAESAVGIEPVPMTDDAIDLVRCSTAIPQSTDSDYLTLSKAQLRVFARAIEAAHGIYPR